jgi:hypothetical protein
LPELERCRFGPICVDGENVYDPDTRDRVNRLGKVIYQPGLCDACTRYVGYTITSLAGAIPDLSKLLEPATAIRYQDPELPVRHHKISSPQTPIRISVLALQEKIDHEISSWTSMVAAHHQLRWDQHTMQVHTRRPFRVSAGCELLRRNLTQFLAMPPRTYPARSTTERRGDGHDPDTTIRSRDDLWTTRDGIDAALELIELDRRATRFAGRHPGDKVPTPCKRCHRRALYREHHLNKIHCRVCHEEYTDDEHDEFMGAVYKAFGIEGR